MQPSATVHAQGLVLRLVALPAIALLLATFIPPADPPPLPLPAVSRLTFAPVPIDRRSGERRQVGKLRYLEGWALSSNDPRFGGISAMHIAGGQAVAVSDAGGLFRFPLPGQAGAVHIGALPERSAQALRKQDRDAEAMTASGDAAWVGFERSNVVRRYSADWSRLETSARPPAMRRWRTNAGAEAMVRLADGRFVIFSEGLSGRPDSPAILFEGDPAVAGTAAIRFRYRAPRGYRITDAAALPDGRLLLLNRRYGMIVGVSAKLCVAAIESVAPGGRLDCKEVADLRAPLTIDNMEAMAVTVEAGRTIVWLASDDNFSPLQRTLLLKFALAG
jgi:hypothetical protein